MFLIPLMSLLVSVFQSVSFRWLKSSETWYSIPVGHKILSPLAGFKRNRYTFKGGNTVKINLPPFGERKFFPYRIDLFSERSRFAEMQTGSDRSCLYGRKSTNWFSYLVVRGMDSLCHLYAFKSMLVLHLCTFKRWFTSFCLAGHYDNLYALYWARDANSWIENRMTMLKENEYSFGDQYKLVLNKVVLKHVYIIIINA